MKKLTSNNNASNNTSNMDNLFADTESVNTLEEAQTIIDANMLNLYAGRFSKLLARAVWFMLIHHKDSLDEETHNLYVTALISSRVRRRVNKGYTVYSDKYGRKHERELHPESYDMEDIIQGIRTEIMTLPRFSYNRIDYLIYKLDRQHYNKGTKYWTMRYFITSDDGYGWTPITWKQYRKLLRDNPRRNDLLASKVIVRNISDTAETPASRELPIVPDYTQSKIHNVLARLLARGMTLSQIANRTGRNHRTIRRLAEQLAEATKLRDKYEAAIANDHTTTSNNSHPDHTYNARYSILPTVPPGDWNNGYTMAEPEYRWNPRFLHTFGHDYTGPASVREVFVVKGSADTDNYYIPE